MKTLEELHAHYKAVRQRLDNPVVKKPTLKLVGHLEPIAIPEPEPAFRAYFSLFKSGCNGTLYIFSFHVLT